MLFVFCFFVAFTAADAAEIFLMLSYKDSGKVFRVKTDYERLRPIGLFFDCDPADGFYIDNLKDFRMLSFKSPETFVPVRTTLFRQVFDGPVNLADFGGNSSQHQDQRDLLIRDSVAKPVFRTLGAPMSCGPGRKISVRPNNDDFAPAEVEILKDHNWYQIANSSWYQTWHKNSDGSYQIFFDEWQEGQAKVVETLWRGQNPAYAASRPIHHFPEKRLLRAITDGTLEIVEGFEKSFAVASSPKRISWAFDPGFQLDKGRLVVYSWSDDRPGSYSFVNHQSRPKLLVESRDAESRHIGFTNDGIMVIGNDIVKNWLKQGVYAKDAENLTCDLAAFYKVYSENRVKVAVFSKGENNLYIFTFDEESTKVAANPYKIKLPVKPEAMCFDIAGNILFTKMKEAENLFFPEVEPGYGVETLQFKNVDSLAEFDEEKGRYVEVKMPEKIVGLIVFSKQYQQELFALEPELNEFTRINDVNLGKKYFYREFTLNKPPEDLLNFNYQQVTDLARKPENILSELKSDVPGFPDQFKKPEKVFIGFYQQ